jgi:hypothetical protein
VSQQSIDVVSGAQVQMVHVLDDLNNAGRTVFSTDAHSFSNSSVPSVSTGIPYIDPDSFFPQLAKLKRFEGAIDVRIAQFKKILDD